MSKIDVRMLGSEALNAYRCVVRAMVRSDRKSRIAQRLEQRRKDIATLTYKRMNVVRAQNLATDTMQKAKLFKDLQLLNRQVDLLKNEDIEHDRRLLFVGDTSILRQNVLDQGNGDRPRMLQHLKDIAAFLNNQREYDELIERYNGGSKLSQSENVKRTAGKVGLQVPF